MCSSKSVDEKVSNRVVEGIGSLGRNKIILRSDSDNSIKDDFQLVLDETPKGSHSKETGDARDQDKDMSGPLSENLVTNTLLYQDCENIDNDEDVQSRKEILELDQSNKEDVR